MLLSLLTLPLIGLLLVFNPNSYYNNYIFNQEVINTQSQIPTKYKEESTIV